MRRREPAVRPTPLPPAQWADDAAEAIRSLNHATAATHADGGYGWPGDLDAVLGSLTLLAQRLPQACHQAGAWLAAAHAEGRVGHCLCPPPPTYPDQTRQEVTAVAVAEVVEGLEEAAAHAEQLATALQRAQTATYPLIDLPIGEGR